VEFTAHHSQLSSNKAIKLLVLVLFYLILTDRLVIGKRKLQFHLFFRNLNTIATVFVLKQRKFASELVEYVLSVGRVIVCR